MSAAAEFAKLKALHGAAVLLTEGGNPVALLPAFDFKAAGADVKMNLLLTRLRLRPTRCMGVCGIY